MSLGDIAVLFQKRKYPKMKYKTDNVPSRRAALLQSSSQIRKNGEFSTAYIPRDLGSQNVFLVKVVSASLFPMFVRSAIVVEVLKDEASKSVKTTFDSIICI